MFSIDELMLRTLYLHIGLPATTALVVLVLLTAFAWFVALAGVTVRPMSRNHRIAWIAAMTLFPPSSLAFLGQTIVRERRSERKGIARGGA